MSDLATAQPDVSLYARRAASALRRVVQTAAFRGNDLECPICGGQFRRWAKAPRAVCPRCLSRERHRLLWLYLARHDFLSREIRILHFAPEPGLRKALQRLSNVDYTSADLDPRLASIKVDITDIPFKDDLFDLILCSHVLEHVPDDAAAMREMRRVVKSSGAVVLQHPIHYGRETYEDSRWTTPADRLREFGHPEHVRIYGREFSQHLEAAGFEVALERYRDSLSAQERRHFGLDLDEPLDYRGDDIYVCRKRPELNDGSDDL